MSNWADLSPLKFVTMIGRFLIEAYEIGISFETKVIIRMTSQYKERKEKKKTTTRKQLSMECGTLIGIDSVVGVGWMTDLREILKNLTNALSQIFIFEGSDKKRMEQREGEEGLSQQEPTKSHNDQQLKTIKLCRVSMESPKLKAIKSPKMRATSF